jgi:hypothetical protein
VFGVTGKGHYLVVFVAESKYDDNDWDVVAARECVPTKSRRSTDTWEEGDEHIGSQSLRRHQ